MSQAVSASSSRAYGLARVCRVWEVARATVYRRRSEKVPKVPRRRGPQGPCSDAELRARIEDVLARSPWTGEGHRKVWARLRMEGLRTSQRRVLRVMREAGLLAPTRAPRVRGPQVHDGTIIPERPDTLWGTDLTTTITEEGTASIFVVVDHCTAECLGVHAARRGTRFEALEPLRQAVRETTKGYAEAAFETSGLTLRHDHGSQFLSDVYQDELRFLGIRSSPAFVRQPEGNGCAERFVRTLKEQLLWIRKFATIEDLNQALQDFKRRYNHEWLIQRHGYRPPATQRALLRAPTAAAAAAA